MTWYDPAFPKDSEPPPLFEALKSSSEGQALICDIYAVSLASDNHGTCMSAPIMDAGNASAMGL